MHKSNYDLIRVIVFLIFFLEDSKNSEQQLISEEELLTIQNKYQNLIEVNLLSKFTSMKKNINSPQSTILLEETIQHLCAKEGWFTEKVLSTNRQRMEFAKKKINNIFKAKWEDICDLNMTAEQWEHVKMMESKDANYYKNNQVWRNIVLHRKKSTLTYGDVATLLQEKEAYIKNRNAPQFFNPIFTKEFLVTRIANMCLVEEPTESTIKTLLQIALSESTCHFLHYIENPGKEDTLCTICGLQNYNPKLGISRSIFLDENTVYQENGATTLLSNSNGNTTKRLQQYAVTISLMQRYALENKLLDLCKKNYLYFIYVPSCQDLMPPLRKICYVRHWAKEYKNQEVENKANKIIDDFYTNFNGME